MLHDRGDSLLILSPVLLVQLCSDAVGRTVRVGLVQQTLDGGEDGGHVVRGRPAVLEDVKANAAIGIHVGVEHLGNKADRGRLVRVFFSEL